MFAYCGNNPSNYTDSSGLLRQPAIVAMEDGAKSNYGGGIGITTGSPVLDVGTSMVGAAIGAALVEATVAIGAVITAGALALNFRRESKKEKVDPIADVVAATPNSSDIVIYRYYASKTDNLAPRPGKDYDGLSFSTKPPRPGVEAVQTTIGAVNATGILEATLDSKIHVTVKPTGGGTVAMWMAMGQNSPWTQALSLIVVEIEG